MRTNEQRREHSADPQIDVRTFAPWLLGDYFGKQWQVKSHYGKIVTINFDVVLPDGRKLTDERHANKLDIVRRVAFEIRSGPFATVDTGEAQRILVSGFVQFISWMVLNGFERFYDLSPFDIKAYLADASKGYEHCLEVVSRVSQAIDSMLSAGIARELISIRAVLDRAHIPREQLPHLKNAVAAYRMRLGLPSRDTENRKSGRNALKSGSLALNSLHLRVLPIEKAWQCHERLDEEFLSFNPFPHGIGVAIAELGRPDGHTKTIPVKVAFHLAEKSVKWITIVGPSLMKLRGALGDLAGIKSRKQRDKERDDLLAAFNRSEAGKEIGLPVVLKKRDRNEESVVVQTILAGYLPTACFITLAMLLARRLMEILSIEEGAIEGNAEDGWWVKTIIEKTLKREDFTPCPEIVVLAVALLQQLKGASSATAPDTKLFVSPRVSGKTGRHVRYKPELWINAFAKFVGVPMAESGPNDKFEWWFSPHQFRRLFAILFVWRFEDGDIGALSYHLRHFNLKMTRVYVRDAELHRLIGEEHHRLTVSKLKAITNREVHAVGIFGKSLKRMIERFRKTVDVVDDFDMERKIVRLVEDKKLSLKANAWGYCGCSASLSNLRRAACQSDQNLSKRLDMDGSPDTTGSDESMCAGCLFHFTDETRKVHWISLEKKLRDSLKDHTRSNLIHEALRDRHAVIQSFVRNSFGAGSLL